MPKNWMFGGIELTDEQMLTAKKNGLSRSTIRARMTYGWELDEAVRFPPRFRRKKEEIEVKQETKEDRKRAWERRKEQTKKRMDIAAFASEIGISYGMAASCLDSGMSREEIRKKYGKTHETPTHRWAVKI